MPIVLYSRCFSPLHACALFCALYSGHLLNFHLHLGPMQFHKHSAYWEGDLDPVCLKSPVGCGHFHWKQAIPVCWISCRRNWGSFWLMGGNGFTASESSGRVCDHARSLQEAYHRWQKTEDRSAAVIKLTTKTHYCAQWQCTEWGSGSCVNYCFILASAFLHANGNCLTQMRRTDQVLLANAAFSSLEDQANLQAGNSAG